jgi:hypothetical protein
VPKVVLPAVHERLSLVYVLRGQGKDGEAMTPFVKVNHRFGNVFLRFVYMTRTGRKSIVARMDSEEAEKIGPSESVASLVVRSLPEVRSGEVQERCPMMRST